MITLREMFEEVIKYNEDFVSDDLIVIGDLDYSFNNEYGYYDGPYPQVYTKDYIYFLQEYDGMVSVHYFKRNPEVPNV